MTVDELLRRISSKELTEWKAYWELEPWGEMRADLRVGTLSALVANIMRPKGRPAFSAKDFFYADKPTRTRPTDDELLTKARAMHAVLVAHFKATAPPGTGG